MILVDAQTDNMPIIYVNEAFETLTGYSSDEIIGYNCRFLQGNDRNQPDLDILRDAIANKKSCTVTLRNYRKDGTLFWNELRVSPISDADGQVTHFVGIQHDVTERKRMEEALRRSEREFRTLAERSPDNIQRLDRDGKHLYVNAAYATALALPADQIIGKTNEDLGMPTESIVFFAEMRERVYTSKQPVEFDFSYPDGGEMRYFNTRMIPEFDPEGNVISLLSVSRDITERKKAQQRELELQLERERRNLLTTFFQNAAHEFRTPLATISSGAYLMARSDDSESRTQKATQIEGHVKRITSLVDSLLLMTRLEGNGIEANSPVDMGEVLRSVLEKAKETCAKNHDLRIELQPDMPTVMGDADYLNDAFQQIIGNACRFTPEGGKIEVQAGSADDHIWIEICDTGPGIPENDLPHIFETFWRQDAAHCTPGFGLGLPIAQRIVERHGGEISVESIKDEGCKFRIVLPVSEQQ